MFVIIFLLLFLKFLQIIYFSELAHLLVFGLNINTFSYKLHNKYITSIVFILNTSNIFNIKFPPCFCITNAKKICDNINLNDISS